MNVINHYFGKTKIPLPPNFNIFDSKIKLKTSAKDFNEFLFIKNNHINNKSTQTIIKQLSENKSQTTEKVIDNSSQTTNKKPENYFQIYLQDNLKEDIFYVGVGFFFAVVSLYLTK